MRITKFKSLEFQTTLVSALLLSILIVLLGISIKSSFDAGRQAKEYVIKNRVSGLLNIAAGWQAIERGYGATVIGSGKGASSSFFSKFLETAKRGDSEVSQIKKEIYTLLSVKSDKTFEKALSKWQEGYKSLVSARHRIANNDISNDEWLDIATQNIRCEFNLRSTAFTPQRINEKILFLNNVLRPNIAILCDYAGLERALISNAIESGTPLSQQTLNSIKRYRSIVDQSLDQILILKESPSTSVQMMQAISIFEKEYMQSYQHLKEEIFSSSKKQEEEIASVNEDIVRKNIVFQKYLYGIKTDLLHISKNKNIIAFAKSLNLKTEKSINQSKRPNEVERLFNNFSQVKRVYDQIRFLDNSGHERAHIDFDNNTTNIVSDTQLQNKSERYYFKESLNLPRGVTYTSLMDLNVEHGKIEISHKPVMRFITPVFVDGKRAGAIVFHLLTNTPSFLHQLAENKDEAGYILANQNGFYLHYPEETKEWEMMESLNKSHHNLRQDYPDVAAQILSGREGSVRLASGKVLVYKPFFFDLETDTDNFWVVIKKVNRVNYPISALIWFNEATKVINKGLAISEIAGEEASAIMLEMELTAKRNTLISYIIFAFAVFVFVYFSRWTRNHILKPVQSLSRVTQKIAEGDLSHRADIKRRDEIGTLANNFNIMTDKLTSDITMRKQAERSLSTQYDVTKALAESNTIKEASPRILQDMCTTLGWDLGEIWIFEQQDLVLRCSEIWHIPSIEASEFKQVTMHTAFAEGRGLPGRIFKDVQPTWIEDIVQDDNFPRAAVAARDGFHGAFGFPILCGREALGTVSFYSREIREPDKDLLNTVLSIGNQIGLFIKRKLAENEHKKMEKTLVHTEKLKSLGEVTAGVAHEFNNILAVMMGSAEVLEENFKGDRGSMKRLKAIIKAGTDGAEIVNRMLIFAKTETEDTFNYIFFDIRHLIKEAIGFTMPRWKNMAQTKGINYCISTDGMKEVAEVLCNPTELREVFVNMINNALDAMPDGGNISFSSWSDESTVYVSVSDTGKGMPEEVKKKIFEPFFTTRKPQGTGLGMSISYGVIKRHGGKIDIVSEEEKGTTFNIIIPISKKTTQRVVTSEPVREIETKELRILVVDDEQELCEILNTFLAGNGHIVKVVNNGAKAIELAKQEDFDLVLSDLAMPDVTGHDVLKALNKLDKRPKVGIITGGEENLMLKEGELKADFIVNKPFSLSKLARQINDVFSDE